MANITIDNKDYIAGSPEATNALIALNAKIGAVPKNPTAISVDGLNNPQTPITVSTFTPPTTPPITPVATTTTDSGDWLKKYLTESPAPTDISAQYTSDYNALGLDTLGQDVINKQAEVKKAQGELANINASLSGITAGQTAQELQTAKEGINAVGLSARNLSLERENAIKALPLQVQALVAQAKIASAQGDVQTAQQNQAMAQNKLDTLFKMHSDYNTAVYNYNKDLRDKAYEYATKEQQIKLDAKTKEDERNFTIMRDNLNNAQNIAKAAVDAGQADIASQITQLDPKSPTFTTDLAKLQGQIKKTTGTSGDNIRVQDAKNLINLSKGSDGLIAWETYSHAAQNWISEGGNITDFKAAFPAEQLMDKGNLNKLPESLQPSGYKPIPTVQDVQTQTRDIFNQYKTAGYSRQQVEDQWKSENNTTTVSPLIQSILDELYPSTKSWWQFWK